jgi:hypothetical protein
MAYEGTKFVVYQTVIVLGDEDNLYFMTDDKEEAVQAARDWLAEECGGTEEDYEAVAKLTDDEIADKILDYDHVAFCDVANAITLFGERGFK